jgi:hypothetical protein
MAAVKLTDNLVRTITSNAHSQFSEALRRCKENLDIELAKFGPHLIPEKHRVAFNSLPDEYFPQCSRITIKFGDYSASYQFQVRVPYSYNQYNSVINASTLDVSPELIASCTEAMKKLKAMQQEADAFQCLVQENLREFATLNAAVKEWPALEKLVPKEYLDRMRTKVERAAKSKMDEEAKQALNTAMLKSQIL